MTEPDSLVAPEGVDAGSADSTTEAATPRSGDVLGDAPHGEPAAEPDDAAPLTADTDEAQAARDAVGTGQQLQEGEG